MKKKLLPFILGCAMIAAMPLAAHAELLSPETANEVTTGMEPEERKEGLNGFTEYNDTESTENILAKTFNNSTSTGSQLGNTRNAASTMQTGYPVDLQNEQQGYRATSHSLVQDIDPDNTDFADQTNDTDGTTDLETSVPEFDMQIPASTVLPLGATRWRLGNVKINGRYFVRPDKVKVVVTKQNFHNEDTYVDSQAGESDTANQGKFITFDVTDKRYATNSVVGAANCKYFFQDGTNTLQAHFPYAYETYVSANYEAGLVSEINETHQVWALSNDWSGKDAGRYEGSITFNASVVADENNNMYGTRDYTANDPYYPGEGHEYNPNA